MMVNLLLAVLQVLVTVSVTSPLQDPDAGDSTWSLSEPYQDVPVLQFPESSVWLKRRKREWIIPPINFPENSRGPFPKQIVQIESAKARNVKITYSITGGGADLPPVGIFTVDRNTGWLYVNKALDRETKDLYVLKVHAVAAEGEDEPPIDIIVHVIDMNDNKPVFTQDTFHGCVPEVLALGYEFMKVTATDADDPRTDNADIRYSIISQTPTEPHPKMFDINPVTGGIRVAAKGLDIEKHPKYTLEIQAADMLGHGLRTTGKAVITVTDINENAPQFENTSHTVSVPEIALGAVVVKLRVKDEDEPQTPAWTARFHILNGTSDGLFSVSTGPSKQEGIITTAKPLDFEQEKQHTLLVIVENDIPFSQPLPTSTATVTVNVLNAVEPEEKCTCLGHKPYQDVPVLQFPESSVGLKRRKREWVIPPISFPENDRGPFPKQIAQIKSTKAKEVKITYSITGEGADLPPVGLFTVDRNTGWLYVSWPLDREVKDKYVLQAHAVAEQGEGENPIEIVANVIDMNDNKPVFTQDIFYGFVPETSPIGIYFMKVTATDADDPISDNADIRYSIISQRPAMPQSHMFAINPVTGAIRVLAKGLDGEKYPEYTLEIQAADMTGQGLTATGKAVITVMGINNHAPQRQRERVIPPINIRENYRGPFPKQMVQVCKTDHFLFVKITYSISGGGADLPPVGLFTVNRNTGWLSDTRPRDLETEDKYVALSPEAESSPRLSNMDPDPEKAAQTVAEPYQDVPVLQFPESSVGLKRRKREWIIPPINFPENDKGPYPKQMVQIKSSKSKDVTITYSITGEGADLPPVGLFTINRKTGWLYVTKPLDRDTKNYYVVRDFGSADLEVHAVADEGEGEPPIEIIANVIDMNDNKPVFTQDTFLGSVPEVSSIGYEFMAVTATDADDPNTDNADIRYSIFSQNPVEPNPNMFNINPVTGAIRVSAESLDREVRLFSSTTYKSTLMSTEEA
ncbi:cadherin-2-like [Hoplias malabaricus]|uniref:cadherin-2-like n=1 Tax=Hoplias malabaricus TaxID=27720 RepID=UPI00346375B5